MRETRILVIDNDHDMCELIQSRLESKGYNVVTAEDGNAGIEKTKQENFDLILLDVKMGEVDGYTVLKELKKNKETRGIPVIMLSGYTKMEELFRGEGVADFVAKPFDTRILELKIEDILKKNNPSV
ncbi:MAG: response regulator [Candidatus Omnitrophota bacterium]